MQEWKKEVKNMFCKNCGANLNPTDKFCQNCGAPVQAGPVAPPPPPVYAVPPTQPVYGAPVSPQPMPGYGYPTNPKVQTAQRMIQKYRKKWVFPCISFLVTQLLAIIFYAVAGSTFDYATFVSMTILGGILEGLSGLFFLFWLIYAIILNVNKKIVRRNG